MRLTIIFYLMIFICIISISNNCPYVTSHRESDKHDVDDNAVIESYKIIEIHGSSFTLEWDSPRGSSPNSYNIYFKGHTSPIWKLLDTIPYNQLEYEINYNNLDGGQFHDFGISAIYYGEESFLHYSLDNEAEPSTGWYIKWVLE